MTYIKPIMCVWNVKEDRPATPKEIFELEKKRRLVINWYIHKRGCENGHVWIDLSSDDYELCPVSESEGVKR